MPFITSTAPFIMFAFIGVLKHYSRTTIHMIRFDGLRAIIIMSIIFLVTSQSTSFAVDPRYTWRLQKTVIEATIVYTYEDCIDNNLKFKINPTLIPRTLPDPLAGGRVETNDLLSVWADGNISVQTFGGSGILSSIGSSPTNQVGQIAGNILGGIAKLVAVALGVPPVAGAAAAAGPPPASPPNCATGNESVKSIKSQIDLLKKKVKDLQRELTNGVDEAMQKKDTAAIQAAQSLVAILQDELTITIKATIDPGVTPILVRPENAVDFYNPRPDSEVGNSGLIATICPSKKQLEKWFDGLDQVVNNAETPCSVVPLLQVNVYLDFQNAHGTMYFASHDGPYKQTNVPMGYQYRDVAYIPIAVWRGVRQTNVQPQIDKEGSPVGAVQLIAPQMMAFGQFGVAQQLPITAALFKTLTWQITFWKMERGRMRHSRARHPA